MDARSHNEMLYHQALSAALGELHGLNAQIDQLRGQLDRLERQKAAVASICNAISQWVEAKDAEVDPDEMPGVSVGLTEEEVSLIAYPARATGQG